MSDKIIEKDRYNQKSQKLIETTKVSNKELLLLDTDNFEEYLRKPYKKYHELISHFAQKGVKQLDLCCGNGMHSFTAAKKGASVIALDYAEKSIEIAKRRSELVGVAVDFRVCDVENLPFEDGLFDIVTCAGSLSYLDHKKFFSEIVRVLKPGGVFICIDSYNHNFIYRFNRFVHYLKNERSWSTLKRMPNSKTLKLLKQMFSEVEVEYFGIFTFLGPLIRRIHSARAAARIIEFLDKCFRSQKKYSFKIVFYAKKNK